MKPTTINETFNETTMLTLLQTNTATQSLVALEDIGHSNKIAELICNKGGEIPGLRGCVCTVHVGDGMAVYEIQQRRSSIVCGVIAWTKEAEPIAWETVRTAAAELGPVPVIVAGRGGFLPPSEPDKPEQLPWLAMSLMEGALGKSPSFFSKLGEFERALGSEILRTAREGDLEHPMLEILG